MSKEVKDKITKTTAKKVSKTTQKEEKVEVKERKPRKNTFLKNRTMIVGCGRLGASVANKLSKEGKNVIVVDNNKNAFESLDDSFSGFQIVGDVSDLNTLENAYIHDVKEIIITTGNDNINIFLANVVTAKYDVPEIYVRIDNPEMVELLDDKRVNYILPFLADYKTIPNIQYLSNIIKARVFISFLQRL